MSGFYDFGFLRPDVAKIGILWLPPANADKLRGPEFKGEDPTKLKSFVFLLASSVSSSAIGIIIYESRIGVHL